MELAYYVYGEARKFMSYEWKLGVVNWKQRLGLRKQ